MNPDKFMKIAVVIFLVIILTLFVLRISAY